jgi:hypothetical protein
MGIPMSNFSQKSQVIIESFQKDRGELPVQESQELVEFKSFMKDYVRYKIMNEQSGHYGPSGIEMPNKVNVNNPSELFASLKQGESVKSGPHKGLGRGALARLMQMEKGTEEEKQKAVEYGKEKELHASVEAKRKEGESRWFDVTKSGEVDPNELAIATDVGLSLIPVGGIASGAARLALAKSPLGRAAVSKGLDVVGKLVGRTPTSKLGGGALNSRLSKGLVRGIQDVEKDLLKAGAKGIQTGTKAGWDATKWAAGKSWQGIKASAPAATKPIPGTPAIAPGIKTALKTTMAPLKSVPGVKQVLYSPIGKETGSVITRNIVRPVSRGTLASEYLFPEGNITQTTRDLFSGDTSWSEAGEKIGKRLGSVGNVVVPFNIPANLIAKAAGTSVPEVAGMVGKSAIERISGTTTEEMKKSISDAEKEVISRTRKITDTQQKQKSSGPTWEEFRDHFKGMDPNSDEEAMRKSWERQFGGN